MSLALSAANLRLLLSLLPVQVLADALHQQGPGSNGGPHQRLCAGARGAPLPTRKRNPVRQRKVVYGDIAHQVVFTWMARVCRAEGTRCQPKGWAATMVLCIGVSRHIHYHSRGE